MPSEIEICNIALSLIGDDFIKSFEEETKQARFCSMFFSQITREVLHKCIFKESVKRSTLTKVANVDLSNTPWECAFQLPKDYIRVIKVNDGGIGDQIAGTPRITILGVDERDFEIEGDLLLINQEQCNIRYVHEITDFSCASPLLIKAIAYSLAARIAHAITGSMEIMERMEQKAAMVVKKAKYAQAKELRSGENSTKRRYQQQIGLVLARRGDGRLFDEYIPLINTN